MRLRVRIKANPICYCKRPLQKDRKWNIPLGFSTLFKNDFNINADLLSCQKTTYPHACNTQQEELM